MKFLKNNMGIIITLILVILLSQSRFFDLLIDTYLGRLILITFVSLIAYSNKMIGLAAVLFIIIAFNYNNTNIIQSYNYYEGFGNSVNEFVKDKSTKNIQTPLKHAENVTTTSSIASSNISSKINNVGGREGFCTSDRELNILRGKQSNVIPVFKNYRNQNDDDVLPSDKSIFSDLFSSF
jgi:hypothetical protein